MKRLEFRAILYGRCSDHGPGASVRVGRPDKPPPHAGAARANERSQRRAAALKAAVFSTIAYPGRRCCRSSIRTVVQGVDLDSAQVCGVKRHASTPAGLIAGLTLTMTRALRVLA